MKSDNMAAQCKYDDKYCQELIDHMSKGHSFRTFAAIIKVARSTLYKWVDDIPEFAEAKELAEDCSLLTLEEKLIKHQDGTQKRNSELSAITFPMKTRFSDTYSDKSKVEHQGKIEINIDSDDAEL